MSLMLAAIGVNFASRFLQGVADSHKAAVQAADYREQANIYRRNAALLRLNGAINEDIMRTQNRAYTARSSAAAGEAGMGESETFATALATTAAALEQNVLNARYQVESEAMNYLYQANVAEENARQLKKKGRNYFQNGLMNGMMGAFDMYNSLKGDKGYGQ